jgi:hypothetical protein
MAGGWQRKRGESNGKSEIAAGRLAQERRDGRGSKKSKHEKIKARRERLVAALPDVKVSSP